MFSVWFITRHPAAKKSQNLLSLRLTDGQTDRQTDKQTDPLTEMPSSQTHINIFTYPYEGDIAQKVIQTVFKFKSFGSIVIDKKLICILQWITILVYQRVGLNFKAKRLILDVLKCSCPLICSRFFRFKELIFFLLNFRNPFFYLFSPLSWKRPMFIVYNFRVIDARTAWLYQSWVAWFFVKMQFFCVKHLAKGLRSSYYLWYGG